jgi:hypothetical protein
VRWLRPRPVPKVPPTRLDTRLLVASDDLTSITIYSCAISPLVPLRATTTRAIFTVGTSFLVADHGHEHDHQPVPAIGDGEPSATSGEARPVDQRMAEMAMSAFAGCGHVVAHALGSNGGISRAVVKRRAKER